MPLEIKCGLYARPKPDTHEGRLWRRLGIGVVTFVNNHSDCEPALEVTFAGGGQRHVWWASQLELSEWIDPLDCVFP